MYCSNCEAKHKVLEGEVTCPDCGSLLEPVDLEEELEPSEDLLGLDIEDDDGELEEDF